MKTVFACLFLLLLLALMQGEQHATAAIGDGGAIANAAAIPGAERLADLPPFLRDHPLRPRPLSPSAETCFRRSIELAPDLREAYEELFHYLLGKKQHAKAEKAAHNLLERFPDHVPTLEELGDLLMEREKYAEGLELFQRALKANPALGKAWENQVSQAQMTAR